MELTTTESQVPSLLPNIKFGNLNRSEFQEIIKRARLLGIDLTEHNEFYETIERFTREYEQRDGKAFNTRRNLAACWRYYKYWAQDNGYGKFILPASPKIIEEYLEYRASFVAQNTLSLDCWGISTMHKVAGCPDPFDDFNVDTTKKRLFRQLIEQSEGVEQAYGFRFKHLKELNELIGKTFDPLLMRTLCIAFVAYETMLRESELARIKIAHIERDENGATLKIPFTKTNKSGESEYAKISSEALDVIRRYLKLTDRNLKSTGYLFAPLSRTRKPLKNTSPISVDVIDKAFHSMHAILGLQDTTPRFKSHSARVGGSQDLAIAGFTVTQIMQSGRWSSERMVYSYCRRFFAKESGMAMLREQQIASS